MATSGAVIKALLGPALMKALKSAPIERALIVAGGQLIWCQIQANKLTTTCVSTTTLRAALEHEAVDSGWLPQNVVRWGTGTQGTWIVQFHPPAKRKVQVFVKDHEPLVEWEVPFPGIVFSGCGTTYHIWAIRETTFSPHAQVYHAPFPNVDRNGRICYGANKVPVAAWDTIQTAWDMFISTPFNNHQMSDKSRASTDDVRIFLGKLHEDGSERYPVDDLLPTWRSSIDQVTTALYEEGGRGR